MEPADATLNVTPMLPLALPGATGPKFCGVTSSRTSVMLPPFTDVWIAPRRLGPVVPVLATWKSNAFAPTRRLPRVSVGVALAPFVMLAPVIVCAVLPAARIWPVPDTFARALKALPTPKLALM